MMNKSSAFKKTVTILTVLALLVMILPMTVVAKGRPATLPDKASDKAVQALINHQPEAKDTEAPDASDKKSDQAKLIAARNAWAQTQGITPGHANLLYKYLIISKTVAKEAFSYKAEDMQTYLASEAFKAFYNKDTSVVDVKALMSAIKSFKLVVDAESDDEPAPASTPTPAPVSGTVA